jgi:hypothetical protein
MVVHPFGARNTSKYGGNSGGLAALLLLEPNGPVSSDLKEVLIPSYSSNGTSGFTWIGWHITYWSSDQALLEAMLRQLPSNADASPAKPGVWFG